MKAVIQRCSAARVVVDGQIVGEIGLGLVVFLGVEEGDDEQRAERLAAKIAKLRVFNNEGGKFDRSLVEMGGAALVISNFTLCGDARKGNRPNFMRAAAPAEANRIYERFVTLLEQQKIPVQSGVFGAAMTVTVSNDGPVTLMLET